MRIIFALLLSLVAFSARADYVITNDPGGEIIKFVAKYNWLHRHKVRVVIDGWCASACTLALALPRTCVTPRAVLGFHAAYLLNPITGAHVHDQEDTDYIFSQYPPAIRRWITAHGGLRPGILIMGPKTARSMLPHCESYNGV